MRDKKTKRPILAPVDFSTYSEAALVQAADLAGCMDLPLVVLHVVHDPNEMPGYYAKMAKKKQLHRIEDTAAEMLDEFLQKATKEHAELKKLKKVQTMLVVGLPVNRILEVAERTNATMVVMGSQGRTGLKHLLLGSRAEQVVQLCPVPVMIVKSKNK